MKNEKFEFPDLPKRIDVTSLPQMAIDFFFYTQHSIEVEGLKFDIEVSDIAVLCDECDMYPHKYKSRACSKVCSACIACELHLARIGKDMNFRLKLVEE